MLGECDGQAGTSPGTACPPLTGPAWGAASATRSSEPPPRHRGRLHRLGGGGETRTGRGCTSGTARHGGGADFTSLSRGRSPTERQEASFNILKCGREGGKSCHPVLAATPACSESLQGVSHAHPLRRPGWLGSWWRRPLGGQRHGPRTLVRHQAALGSPLVVQEALTAVLTLGTRVGTQGQPGALTLSVWRPEVNVEV